MARIDDPTLKVYAPETPGEKRPGPGSAGQSGDDMGLSDDEMGGSESVRELVQEGQYFEAMAIEGVENAADPDKSRVRTRQVREDDVPPEYDGKDPNVNTD